MSLTAELRAKVVAVLEKMNLWEANAKKTEELEEMDTLNPNSLVRVSIDGVSKKLELQKLIDASVSTTYNYFNPSGQLTFVDNELTIPNSQWLINAVSYQKLTPTVIEIPFSETGKTRIDLIYANTLNQILKETGFETVGVAIPPNLPFNTVEVTKIVVTDSAIESVIPPIPSDATKEDKVSGVVAFGTNDYSATVPEVTALVTGLKILVTFENPNTGIARMNLNGLTDEPIVKNYNTDVEPGDLTGTMILMYNLDKWVVVGSVGGSAGISFDSTPTAGSTNAVTSQGIKTYVDGLVVGLWDDRGSFDASSNTFPSSGGSGASGAILKGDIWTISVAGTLGSENVEIGDTVRAIVDTPGTTSSNWAIQQNNIGYVPENSTNKAITMTGNETSNILFLSAKAIYDWCVGLLNLKENLAITSTGNTIQFDTKRIYNSIASPTTGTMTNNLTGAQIGVIQKIYYNHSTTNPFPAGWVRLGSKTYTPSALNIIYAEWVGSSRVEYWISQEA